MSWFSDFIDKLFHRHQAPAPSPSADLSKALEIVADQHKTIQQQSTVIASPPVQAAVNDQPPPGFVKIGNNLVPAPFGVNNYGSPFPSQAAADAYKAALAMHDANVAQLPALMAAQRATGPLSLSMIGEPEKSWLSVMGAEMSFDPRTLASGNFYGEVTSALGGYGTLLAEATADRAGFESKVNPVVVQTVRELATGDAPWMPLAFAGMGGAVYIAQHQEQWRKGWTNVHGTPP